MRGPALSVEVARELRDRLRDAHVTTYNTLNTIFTGGLVAYLLRRVVETPAAERHWLLVLASLLTIIACWSGLFRMLALVRFPSRMSDALISFATGGAGYVMVTVIQEGPRVWMQAAAAVAFFGGIGTLNMLRGGRSDPFNDMVLPLIEADMKTVGYARMGLAPALLAAAASPIPAGVLEWLVVVGAVLALVADDVVWSRAVAHSTHPAALAAERGTTGALAAGGRPGEDAGIGQSRHEQGFHEGIRRGR